MTAVVVAIGLVAAVVAVGAVWWHIRRTRGRATARRLWLQQTLDAGLPVRVAVALSVVDDRATAGLAQAAARWAAERARVGESALVADQLARVGELLVGFARDRDGWAGGLSQLWGGGGAGASVSEAVFAVAGVPAELLTAGVRADGYVHGASSGDAAEGSFLQFLECVEGELLARSDGGSPDDSGFWRVVGSLPGIGGSLGELRTVVASLVDPVDPHEEDRLALGRMMAELGLLDDATTLDGKRQYERRWGEYPNRLLSIARSFSSFAEAEVRTRRAALAELAGAPPGPPSGAETRERELVLALRDATGRYLQRLRALLAAARESPERAGVIETALATGEERLEVVEGQLALCDRELDDGSFAIALMRLTSSPLPVDLSWSHSREYRAACATTAAGLRDLVDARRQALSEWRGRMLEGLDAAAAALADSVGSSANGYLAEREDAWTQLHHAANTLKLQAAQALVASNGVDAGLPVRAAVALSVVDDRATAGLAQAAGELLPADTSSAPADTVDAAVNRVGVLFATLERNSVAWAGASALLMAAITPAGAGAQAWSDSMLGLGAVPEHLARAGADLFAYVHGAFPADLGAAAHEFASQTIQNITPNTSHVVQPHDTLFTGLYHIVTSFEHSLEGHLIMNADEGAALAAYLKGNAWDAGKVFAHRAAESPHVHDALGQLTHAGTATIHGVLGHLPVFTLVFSTIREVQDRRNHDTTVTQGVQNVLIDFAAVTAGIGAGAAVGGAMGLHGLALAPITVPFGALAGAGAAKIRHSQKKKRLEVAVANYMAVYDQYQKESLTLANSLSASLQREIATQRSQLQRTLKAPTPLDGAARDKLRKLVGELHDATARYIAQSSSLLAGVETVTSGTDGAAMAIAYTRFTKAADRLAECESDMRAGSNLKAFSALVAAPLPISEAWAPSEAYLAACVSAATGVRDLANDHRRTLSTWLVDTNDRFTRCKATIEAASENAITTYRRGIDAATAPVAAAASAVEAARAALGTH
jgi:hypothetical protein